MDHSAQIAFKSQRFRSVLSRLDVPEDRIQAPIISNPWHYRHRLRLHFAGGKLGLREARSRRIIEIPSCQVLRPALAEGLRILYQASDWLPLAHAGELELVEGQGAQLACQISLLKRPAQSRLERLKRDFPLPVAALRVGSEELWRQDCRLQYPGADWLLEPGDFSQVNPEVNRAVQQQVCQWLSLSERDTLLDAFCGLGNFALELACGGARIVGVESDAAMVGRANSYAEARGYKTLTFQQADLFAPEPDLPERVNLSLIHI